MDVEILDFAKAFDKVPHWRLLEKLKAHGIGGQLINWIKAWLDVVNREHAWVVLNLAGEL